LSLPNNRINAGTKRARIKVASKRIAKAIPKPIIFIEV